MRRRPIVLVGVVAAVAFVLLAVAVVHRGGAPWTLDQVVAREIAGHRSAALTRAARVVTDLGAGLAVTLAAVFAVLMAVTTRQAPGPTVPRGRRSRRGTRPRSRWCT